MLIKFPKEALNTAAVLALPGVKQANFRIYHAVDHVETYVWLSWPAEVAGTEAGLNAGISNLPAAVRQSHPDAQMVNLALTTDVAGHSIGQAAPWFYMVETDIKPGAETDFDSWYETEHLPGLAAVPGTVRARRYLAENSSPRYYACYDLAQREAFGSPAWLAVRATSWSDRVRPNFINTKRTMFRLVQD
ncbi:hypothetical protein GCM10027288_41450 [Bordetella tumbae]|uniref:hypothetical protein n=1 Tax=Bordetella tumbae TaxID=1649139 RepID=UPI0039F023F7